MSQRDLQHEAEQTSYTLRSSFYYRVHSSWQNQLDLLVKAKQLNLDWSEYKKFGISAIAWQRVTSNHKEVFCHPEVIRNIPRLVTYYRSLALLPQKGAQRLGVSTQGFEDGSRTKMPEKTAVKLAHGSGFQWSHQHVN